MEGEMGRVEADGVRLTSELRKLKRRTTVTSGEGAIMAKQDGRFGCGIIFVHFKFLR
jgi:ribosomal protein S27AE